MPARGCAGPAMGLLHMGQTQRTSSHFTRHLRGRNTGGCGSPRGKSPLPAPLCRPPWPHSLSVEGVLARQHPQLLLHLEIFQADGTGLLWEARRRVRVGANMWDPAWRPCLAPLPPEMPWPGKSRCCGASSRVFPAGSSAQFPNRPQRGGFPPNSQPSTVAPQPRGAGTSSPRPRSACELPSTPWSRGDVLQSIVPLAPTPSQPRGDTTHPVHVQPPGIALQNHLREKRRQRMNTSRDFARSPNGS